MNDIKIYSFDKCPFAQRTRMALIEKELDFDLIEIDVSLPNGVIDSDPSNNQTISLVVDLGFDNA